MMDVAAVLPVRLASTRVPAKALADLAGKPLLWHVWRQVVAADCFHEIVVATDSTEIVKLVESWGATARLTTGAFVNGTERVASIASQFQTSHIVNVQADMPRIEPQLFHQLLRTWDESGAEVITPVYRLQSVPELLDSNLVKVARSESDHAVYFSRYPIPFVRDLPQQEWLDQQVHWGHVGIYGITKSMLLRYAAKRPSPLELAENLEQLRFLELNTPVATFESPSIPLRVDSQDDLARVRHCLSCEHQNTDTIATLNAHAT